MILRYTIKIIMWHHCLTFQGVFVIIYALIGKQVFREMHVAPAIAKYMTEGQTDGRTDDGQRDPQVVLCITAPQKFLNSFYFYIEVTVMDKRPSTLMSLQSAAILEYAYHLIWSLCLSWFKRYDGVLSKQQIRFLNSYTFKRYVIMIYTCTHFKIREGNTGSSWFFAIVLFYILWIFITCTEKYMNLYSVVLTCSELPADSARDMLMSEWSTTPDQSTIVTDLFWAASWFCQRYVDVVIGVLLLLTCSELPADSVSDMLM